MRTRIKICGFTRPEDALTAARLGVDAIGLVFYPPSPRNVDIAKAIEIVAALPAFVTTVALFVNAPADHIARVLDQMPIDLLQFHGNEPPTVCRIYGKPYIKAVPVQESSDIPALADCYYDAAGLLLDAYHPQIKGGTGEGFDWGMIPNECARPIILAGGLQPGNVRDAIRQVKPYALDVSSGVEKSKGIKDADKMAAFLAEVFEGDRKE